MISFFRITLVFAFLMAVMAASRSLRFLAGTLLAVEYAGGDAHWTGVPGIVILSVAALGAFYFGKLTRLGYRRLLLAACAAGLIAALLGGWSAWGGSLWMLLVSFAVSGLAMGILPMSRYAASEVAPPQKRARVMGLVVFGAAFGSFLGPLGMNFAQRAVVGWGIDAAQGVWAMEALMYVSSMAAVYFGLGSGPFGTHAKTGDHGSDMSRAAAAGLGEGAAAAAPEVPGQGASAAHDRASHDGRPPTAADPAIAFSWTREMLSAAGVLMFSQMAMVLVMTSTPIFMRQAGHGMTAVSWTISAHMLGMFGFSFPIGWWADRHGSARSIAWGIAAMAAACCMGFVPAGRVWMLTGLFLLGLGWSACFIAGSRLLMEHCPAHAKTRVQGPAESAMLVASGLSVLGSGLVYAEVGYGALCLTGLAACVLTGASLAAGACVGRAVPKAVG